MTRLDYIRAAVHWDGDLVVPMTCVVDRREHAVTESVLIRCASRGRYEALCGADLLPDSLCAEPGHPCRTCMAILRFSQERDSDLDNLGSRVRAGVHHVASRVRFHVSRFAFDGKSKILPCVFRATPEVARFTSVHCFIAGSEGNPVA